MKKICICTTVSLTMKTFVVETAKYLHEHCGYDITLICSEDEKFEATLPEYLHFIPVHMERGIDFSAVKSIMQFVRIFKEQRFDLVQYSTPNAACYASIAAKVVKVPIRLYCQWGIRYVGMDGISRKIFKAIEKMVCYNSTVIRAQSPLNMRFAVLEGLCLSDKVSVIGYGGTIGVDTKKFDIEKKTIWRKEIREKYNLLDDEFVFGFSGRVTIDKGCRELLTAFKILTEEGTNSKLFIIGPIDNKCAIDKGLIDWAKKSKKVVLTGMIESDEMCKYYSAIDVLVHPTYREGFGMVLQEAGSLGVPSITTRVPGASEVFEDGISTLLVDVKDSDQLTDAMRELSLDRKKTLSLGNNAYQTTITRYNRPVMLENQRRDYELLLGK